MKRLVALAALAAVSAATTAGAEAKAPLDAVPAGAQTALVHAYLEALEGARYADAYALLDPQAQRYYRNAANLRSVYVADAYRLTAFTLLGTRNDPAVGRVYFARERARYRDHAHETDLVVTATVPIGVVRDGAGWRIKDPGHPWRAFATTTFGEANGVRAEVKKISQFARRIEAVVTFVNRGSGAVTLLPYGRSLLRDADGATCRPIETRDWSLTDKTLFEGLRLPPNAQYTGTLSFACDPGGDPRPAFALSLGPLLADGGDAPFAIDVDAIAASTPAPAR